MRAAAADLDVVGVRADRQQPLRAAAPATEREHYTQASGREAGRASEHRLLSPRPPTGARRSRTDRSGSGDP